MVSAAPDGEVDIVCGGELKCGNDVGCAVTAGDECWVFVDESVPDFAGGVVGVVVGVDDGSA